MIFFFCIYLNVNVAWLSFWDFFKKKHWRFLTGTPRWSDFCSLMFFDVCFSLLSQLITAQSQFSLFALSSSSRLILPFWLMRSVRKHWGSPQRGRNSLPHIVAVLSVMRGVEVAINTCIDDYSGSCWKCSASLLISDPLWAVSRRLGEWWGAVHPS